MSFGEVASLLVFVVLFRRKLDVWLIHPVIGVCLLELIRVWSIVVFLLV